MEPGTFRLPTSPEDLQGGAILSKAQNPNVGILDFGARLGVEFGFWILDFEFLILDLGFWILDALISLRSSCAGPKQGRLDFGAWILYFVFWIFWAKIWIFRHRLDSA